MATRRVPAGVPAGGRFAPTAHPESGDQLPPAGPPRSAYLEALAHYYDGADPAWQLAVHYEQLAGQWDSAESAELNGDPPISELADQAEMDARAADATASARLRGEQPHIDFPSYMYGSPQQMPDAVRSAHAAATRARDEKAAKREDAERRADDAGRYLDDAYTDLELARDDVLCAVDEAAVAQARRRMAVADREVQQRLAEERDATQQLRDFLEGN